MPTNIMWLWGRKNPTASFPNQFVWCANILLCRHVLDKNYSTAVFDWEGKKPPFHLGWGCRTEVDQLQSIQRRHWLKLLLIYKYLDENTFFSKFYSILILNRIMSLGKISVFWWALLVYFTSVHIYMGLHPVLHLTTISACTMAQSSKGFSTD